MASMVTSRAVQHTGTTVWQLDPRHTTAEFAVRHLMVSTVKGRFATVAGIITLDGDDLTRGRVAVEIDAASVTTHDEQRDSHLRSPDFFDVANHPTITFVSTGVERLDDQHLRLIGDLTIRGTTRPVTLDTQFHGATRTPFGTEVIGFTAQTHINRREFGLTWNVDLERGGVLVGETVTIALEVEAVKHD
jgi:polyisoprenoid-binding protein YceI